MIKHSLAHPRLHPCGALHSHTLESQFLLFSHWLLLAEAANRRRYEEGVAQAGTEEGARA